ncbi:putative Trichohyalin [Trypanosoma rangeli]|uniref:Putative Trichohyalin n=1 Tax=Trypanosoma rangeli TaxID=5698 RepID=A0A3R7MUS8_TRYRA|nr:putative Trichohyalin [Trypanosoma rangeli]RNF11607.1 putative Trichohyalin [Trypanosoma rangeli]|eukprot:RNF11607.1 putative Trichohyalin [Trypanosoma rangeli]
MNIILSCRASELGSVKSFFGVKRLLASAVVCAAESTAYCVTQVESALKNCGCRTHGGGGNAVEYNVEIVTIGVDNVVLEELLSNSVSRQVVCACLCGVALVAASLVIFLAHCDVRQSGVGVTVRSFMQATGCGGVCPFPAPPSTTN